ncbi:MAG: class I SAM-dependent methyltransferase [Deltaproteobacteria bacterium]|nr:class I SAM-dependent methyltransferase [Deltaproteobacteria bacterium]
MLTVDFKKLDLKPGSRVLDAGCGTGRHLCEAFRARGVDVIGIDVKWEDLAKAKGMLHLMKNSESGAWMIALADVTKLPFKDASFDAVICSEVLEHIPDGVATVEELLRVIKPGKDLVVSVPSYLPERICWALSKNYRKEPGGHIRIYKKRTLQDLLEKAGARCWKISYKHALHSPYWWLKCVVGHNNDGSRLVRIYKRFLEWDIVNHPPFVRLIDEFLNPLIAKSVVLYLRKGW